MKRLLMKLWLCTKAGLGAHIYGRAYATGRPAEAIAEETATTLADAIVAFLTTHQWLVHLLPYVLAFGLFAYVYVKASRALDVLGGFWRQTSVGEKAFAAAVAAPTLFLWYYAETRPDVLTAKLLDLSASLGF